MLKTGKVRRTLVSAASSEVPPLQRALRMLVLNTLQVEPDDEAPWSLAAPIECFLPRFK